MEIIREKANQIITNEEPRIYMVEDDAGGCEVFTPSAKARKRPIVKHAISGKDLPLMKRQTTASM